MNAFLLIIFLHEKIKGFLNEESSEYCFDKKHFFTELLYPEVKNIMEFYEESTDG